MMMVKSVQKNNQQIYLQKTVQAIYKKKLKNKN